MGVRDFTDLDIWKRAHLIAKEVYKVTNTFPDEERYGLTAQLRRCASSVPANIVEGFEREHTKEYIQFLNVAKGSISETRYFIILAFELGYLSEENYHNLEKDCKSLRNILGAVIKKLQTRINQ